MTLRWINQLSDLPTRCTCCTKAIHAWFLYFRASFDQDGSDEFGYNVCLKCRRKEPNQPVAKGENPS